MPKRKNVTPLPNIDENILDVNEKEIKDAEEINEKEELKMEIELAKEDIHPVTPSDVDATLADDFLALAKRIKAYTTARREIVAAALRLLSAADFVGFYGPDGEPVFRVRSNGARKFLAWFGYRVEIDNIEREDFEDGHYMVKVTGQVITPSKHVIPNYAFGSTRLQFFSRRYGKDVPPSRIPIEHVYSYAMSAFYRNALREIGMQEFTIQDLRRAGMEPEKIKKVFLSKLNKKNSH